MCCARRQRAARARTTVSLSQAARAGATPAMAEPAYALERRLLRVDDAAEDLAYVYAESGCPSDHEHDLFVSKLLPEYELQCGGVGVRCCQSDSSNLEKGITGGIVWDAAVVLAKMLEALSAARLCHVRGEAVLELGAGTGLLGLCAAALGARAELTDQRPQMRLMQRSKALNDGALDCLRAADAHGRAGRESARASGPGGGGAEPFTVIVSELDWEHFDADDFVGAVAPGAILCSDCVYNPSLIAPLVACARQLCDAADAAADCGGGGSRGCVVWFAMEVRAVDVLEEFVQALCGAFHVARVPFELQAPSHSSRRCLVYACRAKTPWDDSPHPDDLSDGDDQVAL